MNDEHRIVMIVKLSEPVQYLFPVPKPSKRVPHISPMQSNS